ncbi:N-myc-interactor [Oryzias melastigma]|uniref:N-myc-interactor-like n=1 Tax=Oryzias melastigma TaxID=30732 RepID=A0A3B3DQ72_ORYME|nr:N-myc-interactor [Oryzias melastigma]
MADARDKQTAFEQVDGLEEARKELKELKTKVEKAEDLKSRLILESLEEDEAKKAAQEEMLACMKQQESLKEEFTQNMSKVQDELQKLSKRKQDLLKKLHQYQEELKAKQAESSSLKQKFTICAQIPETDVRFVAPEGESGEESPCDGQPIRGVFTIVQRSGVPLRGGQALLTFEEERVASQILRIARCQVSCDGKSVHVKPKRVTVDSSVKFQVNLNVSRKELKVFGVPPALSEERMRDRLEISFCRSSRGGGEVENLEYDKDTGEGLITFLHPGVAERLALRGTYDVHLDSAVEVEVGPSYDYELQKFQTFRGTTTRTILLDDIIDVEDEEDLQDHLEIHFQKPSNNGGEIECIKYISKGKALQAFLCEDTEEA